MLASISLRGQPVLLNDSYVSHDFTFHAGDLAIRRVPGAKEEIAELSTALVEGGKPFLMPLDNYGFSRRFAGGCRTASACPGS